MEKNTESTKQLKKKSTIRFSGLSKLFDTLNTHGINEEQFRLLYVLSGESSLRDTIIRTAQNEIDVLLITGFVSGWSSQDSPEYALTEKGTAVLEEVNALFVKPAKKKTPTMQVSLTMVQDYNNLFPKIKIPMTGKYAQCNESEIKKSLEWFIHEYGFSWDTILKATENYVREREAENWNYLQTSKYYIRKQDSNKVWVSNLADACFAVASGVEEGPQNHFAEKIV